MRISKRHCPVLLIWLLLLVIQPIEGVSKDPDSTQLATADALMKSGKTVEAARIYYDLWQKDQRCRRCANSLVAAYTKLNNLNDANIIIQNIISTNPKDIQAWLMLIENYQTLHYVGGYRWAIKEAELRFPTDKRILALAKNMSSACEKMINASHSYEQITGTRQEIKSIHSNTVIHQQEDYASIVFKTHALAQRGQYNEAIQSAKRCIAMMPNEPGMYLFLAYLYACTGNLESKLATQKEFAQKFPSHPQTRGINDQIEYYGNDFPSIRENERRGFATDPDYSCWSMEQMPLNVFINIGATNRTSLSIQQIKSEVESCLNAWTNASGGRVRFYIVNSKDTANIFIDLTEDESKLHHSWSGGQGGISTNSEGERIGTVYILTVRRTDRTPINQDEFRSVCLHEIGHALGLSHSSKPGDVMYVQTQPNPITSISENDKTRIRRLYSRQ